MTPEEEYNSTKQDTRELIDIYMNWLKEKKEADYIAEDTPQFAPMDFIIYKDGNFAFYLEAKFRRHKRGFYELEKVPISKYCFAYTFQKKFKKRAYYIIHWEDEVGIIDLTKVHSFSEMVARYDRGEGKDWYAMYKAGDFTLLRDVYFSFITRNDNKYLSDKENLEEGEV